MQFGFDEDNAVKQLLHHIPFVCFVRVRDGFQFNIRVFVNCRLCI